MVSVELLECVVRGYAWGSRSVIARLQGRPVPSPGPEAELWIGAHPADPARLAGTGMPLTELIAQRPEEVLSPPVAKRFGHRLPYLMKVLAAEAPLSLQAHPDPTQAAAGYAAEELAGVPRDAPHRRYVDPHHKPELLVALEPFRALCGFRDPDASAELIAGLEVPALAPVTAALTAGDLAGAVGWLLERQGAPWLEEVVAAAARRDSATDAAYRLVGELAAAYPGDVGVVVALLLNEVTLAPGEAIYMPAGNLHAYLSGSGVEIMAASDNVLRGGLTPKYVDVPELLRVLRFEALLDPVLVPVPVPVGASTSDAVVTWPVPVPEFVLHRVRLAGEPVTLSPAGPRMVLCVAGEVGVDDGVAPVTLPRGAVAFGEGSAVGPLVLAGAGEAFVASTSPQ